MAEFLEFSFKAFLANAIDWMVMWYTILMIRLTQSIYFNSLQKNTLFCWIGSPDLYPKKQYAFAQLCCKYVQIYYGKHLIYLLLSLICKWVVIANLTTRIIKCQYICYEWMKLRKFLYPLLKKCFLPNDAAFQILYIYTHHHLVTTEKRSTFTWFCLV